MPKLIHALAAMSLLGGCLAAAPARADDPTPATAAEAGGPTGPVTQKAKPKVKAKPKASPAEAARNAERAQAGGGGH